jgi:hypothetical protein
LVTWRPRAVDDDALDEGQIEACQRYLELVGICQGKTYNPSPGLLVGVDGNGGVAFAPLDDIRDLRSTFAAIRVKELARHRDLALARTVELKRGLAHHLGLER